MGIARRGRGEPSTWWIKKVITPWPKDYNAELWVYCHRTFGQTPCTCVTSLNTAHCYQRFTRSDGVFPPLLPTVYNLHRRRHTQNTTEETGNKPRCHREGKVTFLFIYRGDDRETTECVLWSPGALCVSDTLQRHWCFTLDGKFLMCSKLLICQRGFPEGQTLSSLSDEVHRNSCFENTTATREQCNTNQIGLNSNEEVPRICEKVLSVLRCVPMWPHGELLEVDTAPWDNDCVVGWEVIVFVGLF